MSADMLAGSVYSTNVWSHFHAPRNAGEFSVDTQGVCSGSAGIRQHGRVVEFQLRVNEDGRVADCRYRVYGCPATIALCSMTSELLKGKSLPAAADFSVVALAEQLELPAEKRAAAIIIEDAIRNAAAGYNSHMRPSPAAVKCTTES